MKGKYLENLTWIEAEAVFKNDPTVIIPLGARLKENAYHLPLNNDWIIAEYLTKRVLCELNVLATPTVQFSYFPAFIEYPGSVNINLETSKQILLDLINSLTKQGVKKIYILNTGVSTNWVLESLRKELNTQGLKVDYFDL